MVTAAAALVATEIAAPNAKCFVSPSSSKWGLAGRHFTEAVTPFSRKTPANRNCACNLYWNLRNVAFILQNSLMENQLLLDTARPHWKYFPGTSTFQGWFAFCSSFRSRAWLKPFWLTRLALSLPITCPGDLMWHAGTRYVNYTCCTCWLPSLWHESVTAHFLPPLQQTPPKKTKNTHTTHTRLKWFLFSLFAFISLHTESISRLSVWPSVARCLDEIHAGNYDTLKFERLSHREHFLSELGKKNEKGRAAWVPLCWDGRTLVFWGQTLDFDLDASVCTLSGNSAA